MVFSHYWLPRATLGLSEEAIFNFSMHKDHLEYSLKMQIPGLYPQRFGSWRTRVGFQNLPF